MVKLSTDVNFVPIAAITQIWSIYWNIFLLFMRERKSILANFVRDHLLRWVPKEVMKKLQMKREFVREVLQVQFWHTLEKSRYVFVYMYVLELSTVITVLN